MADGGQESVRGRTHGGARVRGHGHRLGMQQQSRPPPLPASARVRSLECLMELTRLPYPRLHPFKTQVTRRLRGPLDDPRRLVRQQAVKVRNAWFLLG
ncbi:unnamed protein product [Discosporangium mesarthrocarpum]